MAVRAELREGGACVCLLPSCWTARKVGDREFSPKQVNLCLPLPSSYWALVWGPGRQELLWPVGPIWGESPGEGLPFLVALLQCQPSTDDAF